LQRTSGNIKEAAGVLGIDRSTLYEKIKRYEIPR
jgi:transcriptional regulator of acetoin/glycerol metabolism